MEKEEKYKLLISAKDHHYDNYNKWMTYFYIAIGALFVGYYSIISSEKEIADRSLLEFLIIFLGYICSILWYWSCKGYYYWNLNFIYLLHHYERNLLEFPETEGVYYTFFDKKGRESNYLNPTKSANFSTSKIAILFSFIIAVSWGYLLFLKVINDCCSFCNCWALHYLSPLFASALGIIIASRCFGKGLQSNTKNMADAQLESWPHPSKK